MSLNRSLEAHSPQVAPSGAVLGLLRAGPGCQVAQGAVVRTPGGSVELGAASALLENSVAVGTPEQPVTIGQKVVFGHRCVVIGSAVGDLSEIGNGSILLAGARLGRGCILGEGTLVPPGSVLPDEVVVVGRPGRVVRRVNEADRSRLSRLRSGDLSLPPYLLQPLSGSMPAGANMGRVYAYLDKEPRIDQSAVLFDSAEITGDVVIGAGTIVGAGVKIIGDSHGPVRIGAGVQLLENTVLHLLPDNELIIADGVIIGPSAMIHGCQIGRGTVVEPAAIVCDHSVVGEESLVRAGALVKQRARFAARAVLEGFPADQVGTLDGPPAIPGWALRRADLATLSRRR
ncbi:MAG TPA: UDP-3-O-(3-hydroxymyristoyl) glucosamine N-acyltransferase [Myxococcales bacterium]|nr:UDP-3-O-(3-hydroxymyristoyl) glucosamine N-acyltransferase [Myxococcales bacterium]